VRIVIADDSALLRDGLARLLHEAGYDVVAGVGDASQLLEAIGQHEPDLVIVDIRMPPDYVHEGAQAAIEIRKRWPHIGVLLLSQTIESRYAFELTRNHPTGLGYLLKDHVIDIRVLTDALDRIADGGTVLDPDVVSQFLGRRSAQDRLTRLTDRERDVLTEMAEGRSNAAIARHFGLTDKTIETHISNIFMKLDLLPQSDDHRRVLAVRTWLER
jgi:DNA-binding NarL/FixJ family response regulator